MGTPRHLPALLTPLAYLVGSLVFLWPMPANLGTHIWGDRFDAWTTLWLMDQLYTQIQSGSLSAYTQDILFPIGYNLWSFGHAALQFIGVGLMLLGVPLIAAYNLLLILGFLTSALAAHLFGRTLSGSHIGGFVAGTVFATSPYLYGEGAAGCIELVAAGLIPLFAWGLVRLAREPGWKWMATCAGILAIIGPFNWYYTLFAGMFGLGMVAWQAALGEWRVAGWMVAAMLSAATLDAPMIPLVRRETPTRPAIDDRMMASMDAWKETLEIADGLVPLRELTEEKLEAHDGFQVVENSTTLQALVQAEFTVNPLLSTPGMLAFAIGFLGAVATGRRGSGFVAIAVMATLLTLGPFLRPDKTPPTPETSISWPLPYYFFYQYVPFFSKAYRPYRIAVVTLTACAALGATGVAVLLQQLPRWVLGAVAGGIGLWGWTQPWWAGDKPALRPLWDARVDPLYTELRDLPAGAVIELPLHYQPMSVSNARFQYHQVIHRHPVLNCNQLIRRPDLMAFKEYITQNSFLEALVDIGRAPLPLQFLGQDVNRAIDDGFGYLVLHTSLEADDVRLSGDGPAADMVGQPVVEMLETLFGQPVLSNGEARVFALSRQPEGALYSWAGGNILEPDSMMDARKLGLWVALKASKELPLWSGEARSISFWLQAPSAGLSIRLGERVVDIGATGSRWVWVQIRVESGERDFALVAREDARFRITRLQVVR